MFYVDTETITQEITIKAPPHEVYETLIDSKRHAELIGDVAEISREVGGRFRAYVDYIEGVNLELVPDQMIVQSWRASDRPEGHYSKVIFQFEEIEQKPVEGDISVTRITFTQEGVPAEYCNDVSQGWFDYYWNPMKELLESR